MWVMAHSAGVDVVLGMDFMIPPGIRLDLFHGAAQLPNEIRIPLVKTKNMLDSEEHGSHVNAGPSEQLDIPGHEWREYRLSKRQVALERHILWVRRTKKIIRSVTRFRRGRPQRIKLTNVSDRTVYFSAHDDIAVLVPAGDLPRGDDYVCVDSKKYRDWQVLFVETVSCFNVNANSMNDGTLPNPRRWSDQTIRSSKEWRRGLHKTRWNAQEIA
ncbi:hypothetical protein PI124_g21478 [Phytophthora idaei]|nr:hypothetical protein PI125_g23139 [Phytophthora idaei]KAG3129264.1 hypothetical protein PI126_g21046 [Phytophthora idaei]KAG3233446.1 hypothetical protein PI124_g21478 [Phytophthora idaei]